MLQRLNSTKLTIHIVFVIFDYSDIWLFHNALKNDEAQI